jgi:hypothetical protein
VNILDIAALVGARAIFTEPTVRHDPGHPHRAGAVPAYMTNCGRGGFRIGFVPTRHTGFATKLGR